MRVLITGAAGFIGAHLSARLRTAGHTVLGIDVVEPSVPAPLHRLRLELAGFTGEDYLRTDILDVDALRTAWRRFQPEAVVHLAALPGVRDSMRLPDRYRDVNGRGTLNVLACCEDFSVAKLVFASSSSVYGAAGVEAPARETDAPGTLRSVYAETKWQAELAVRASRLSARAVVLRLFSVYGSHGRPDMMPWRFAEKVLRNEPVELHEGTRRDFTHVRDAVSAIEAALSKAAGCGPAVYNVASGRPVETAEFLHLLASNLGRPAQVRRVPTPPELPASTWGDIQAIRRDLGWVPAVSLHAGISEVARFHLREVSPFCVPGRSWTAAADTSAIQAAVISTKSK
ncbi:MAG TPA: NAD-dependent epimerase/dehydratase family protein [Myxococcaceae bacterium]|nr:NAD-dependent epimerase/dehydratase family protein [Myxococcaceae bacterium]